jgi:hypothetical protein
VDVPPLETKQNVGRYFDCHLLAPLRAARGKVGFNVVLRDKPKIICDRVRPLAALGHFLEG